jgi:hypothetical protein
VATSCLLVGPRRKRTQLLLSLLLLLLLITEADAFSMASCQVPVNGHRMLFLANSCWRYSQRGFAITVKVVCMENVTHEQWVLIYVNVNWSASCVSQKHCALPINLLFDSHFFLSRFCRWGDKDQVAFIRFIFGLIICSKYIQV